jgi:protein-S-isoprenylcysteine O-methyltransferase Ste14
MPQDYGAKPNAIPWPPLIYSAAMLVAWILERFDPWAWLDSALARVPVGVGIGLFALGLALDIWAFVMMRRAGTTVMPNAASTALVTGGPFRLSRNPIYLGNTLAMVGFALAVRWGWLILLVPVTVTAVSWLAISREEAHLERRFGEEWRAYAQKVRRWL